MRIKVPQQLSWQVLLPLQFHWCSVSWPQQRHCKQRTVERSSYGLTVVKRKTGHCMLVGLPCKIALVSFCADFSWADPKKTWVSSQLRCVPYHSDGAAKLALRTNVICWFNYTLKTANSQQKNKKTNQIFQFAHFGWGATLKTRPKR